MGYPRPHAIVARGKLDEASLMSGILARVGKDQHALLVVDTTGQGFHQPFGQNLYRRGRAQADARDDGSWPGAAAAIRTAPPRRVHRHYVLTWHVGDEGQCRHIPRAIDDI